MFYYILSAMLHYDIILIAAAVVPAVVLLVKVYRADRIEAESPAILLALLRSGVLAAVARRARFRRLPCSAVFCRRGGLGREFQIHHASQGVLEFSRIQLSV